MRNQLLDFAYVILLVAQIPGMPSGDSALPSRLRSSVQHKDEFEILLAATQDTKAKGLFSFNVMQLQDMDDLSFAFPEEVESLRQYLATIGDSLVDAKGSFLTNQPTNTFSVLDRETVQTLDALRAAVQESDARIRFRYRTTPVPVVLRDMLKALGAELTVARPQREVVWLETVQPVSPSEIVDLLEGICRAKNWQLRRDAKGVTLVAEKGRVWVRVLSGAVRPVNGSWPVNSPQRRIQWQEVEER